MLVIINASTIIGGVFYEPSSVPVRVPDHVGSHLVAIGNAVKYETKTVAPQETKVKKTLSVSQQARASQPRTATKRPGRKPRS